MKTAILIALSMAAFSSAAYGHVCLKSGDKISGEVRRVETRHPSNHEILTYRFIVLPQAACVDDKTLGHAEGRWVQIVLKNPADTSRLTVGDGATITANYEPPMTAYHIGDIMAFNAVIDNVSTP